MARARLRPACALSSRADCRDRPPSLPRKPRGPAWRQSGWGTQPGAALGMAQADSAATSRKGVARWHLFGSGNPCTRKGCQDFHLRVVAGADPGIARRCQPCFWPFATPRGRRLISLSIHHQVMDRRSMWDLDTFGLGTHTPGRYPGLVFSAPAATQGPHWSAIAG